MIINCYLLFIRWDPDSGPDGVHPGDINVCAETEVCSCAEQGSRGVAEVVQHELSQHEPHHALVWIGPDSDLLGRDKLALKISNCNHQPNLTTSYFHISQPAVFSLQLLQPWVEE